MQLFLLNRRQIFNELFLQGEHLDSYTKDITSGKSRFLQSLTAAKDYLGKQELNFIDNLKILIIGETWCGDSSIGIPAIVNLIDKVDNWEYSIIRKGNMSPEILDLFLTAGKQKIPLVAIADSDGNEIDRWVEKSKIALQKRKEIREKELPTEEYWQEMHNAIELQAANESIAIIKELLEKIQLAILHL